jgi:alcohol dehydrogenase class IV
MKTMVLKTNLEFGIGALENLPKLSSRFGSDFLLVSTSKSLQRIGITENIIKGFENRQQNVILSTDISSDPKSHEINTIMPSLKERKIDAVIGLGGGSSIDTAKAISVLLGENAHDIEDYMGTGKNPSKTLPIIAVPTTSGTGSEVSAGAIITRNKDDLKMGIRGDVLIPKLALLDPALTLTCPKTLTRDAGFDIFSHAFESYISKNSNPVSEEISKNVLDIVVHNLPKVLENPKDISLRSKLMFASLMAGINLLNVGTCLPHRIQYTFGVPTKTTHGQGLAVIYRSWLKYLENVEKVDELSKIFKCKKITKDVLMSIQDFLSELGFPQGFADTSDFPHIDIFIKRLHGKLENDPIYSPKMVNIIYNDILHGDKK